ncbi:chemotaxis protein CheW [Natronospora cellulosivora (SeqCode)]
MDNTVNDNNVVNSKSQIVIFQLADEEYAVDISTSKQIIKLSKVTPVPNTPQFVRGVINLRGQIVPVVDLRKRFNITGSNEKERIITVEVRDTLIGLVVDNINEVIWYEENEIEPAPNIEGEINQEFLKGLIKRGNRILVLIDLDKMLFEKINKIEE